MTSSGNILDEAMRYAAADGHPSASAQLQDQARGHDAPSGSGKRVVATGLWVGLGLARATPLARGCVATGPWGIGSGWVSGNARLAHRILGAAAGKARSRSSWCGSGPVRETPAAGGLAPVWPSRVQGEAPRPLDRPHGFRIASIAVFAGYPPSNAICRPPPDAISKECCTCDHPCRGGRRKREAAGRRHRLYRGDSGC